MPSKPPASSLREQALLTDLGLRLRLARMRRRLTTTVAAELAGVSRTSLHNVETGDAGATMGVYLKVMSALGLEADIDSLAAADRAGREMQDSQMQERKPRRKKSGRRPAASQALQSGQKNENFEDF